MREGGLDGLPFWLETSSSETSSPAIDQFSEPIC